MRHIVFIIALLLSFQILAQAEKEDVKVGLVLSGGGAKGLAHIGVLKIIEEAGVRIDYIGGTSMGAVVGGLYASGYNAAQLDSIFRKVNFDNIIQDNLPRESKTFYERADAEKYVLKLPFDNYKVSLPSSLSKGQNSYNLLTQTLQHVANQDDYSKLPIPFFCVATDVEKGKQVILDKGYLPESISASGALPSLFSPVLLDGKLLIDGGVVNNYPIDELRAKGMDIIIGVDVQDTLSDRKNLKSAPDVLFQISSYRTIEDMEEKRPKTDVYIRPKIDGYSVVSFDDRNDIINLGIDEAQLKKSELQNIAARQHHKKQQLGITGHKDSIHINKVVVTGNNYYTRSYVLGKLKLEPPTTVSYTDFYHGIDNLAATENFDRIGHKFKPSGDGHMLKVDVQESSSTQSIKLALHYDDLYRSAGLINFTKKRVLFNNDIVSLDFIIGDNIRYNFDYYIDKGFYWSVGTSSSYTSFNHRINAALIEDIRDIEIEGVNKLSLDFQDLTNTVYLQTLFMKQFSLDLGIKHKYIDIETETLIPNIEGETGLVFEKSHLGALYGQLKFDSLDDLFFPNKGVFFDADFDLFLFSSDFTNTFTEFGIANVEFKYATSIGDKFTTVVEASGGFKVGGAESRTLDFFLGGYGAKKVNNITPFIGYDFLSIAGDGYIKTGITLDYEIFKKNHINLSANFANVGYDLFDQPENWFTSPSFSGYGLGYGAQTFLGPLEIKYTYSPEIDTGEWFISLGFQF